MINLDQKNIFNSLYHSSSYAFRIISELYYAERVAAVNGGKYDSLVTEARDILLKAINDDGVITQNAAMQAENVLLPMKDAAKKYRVHCIAHAHIDMNWMWGYQETVSVTIDTFRTVLDLMKEYPDLTFAQSQASTYEIIERFAPSMLTEIKERIKEGRWEVSASTWTETDKNMPCGESLARHILYTKRYLSKLLDIAPEKLSLDFEPDTFGHNVSVPEICSAGGVKYYYHCRGNDGADHIYRWRGRAGAELLVFREADWYNATVEPGMLYNVPEYCEKAGTDCWINVYGVGDHGGGPTRRDVETIIKMASWPIMPTVIFSTYGAFFKELEAFRESFPIQEGEMNFLFNGCYTSQSKIKMANRISEDRIYESETLATASVMVGGEDFRSSFVSAWKNILFNHFHDILPGSGVSDTREYAMGRFQETMSYVGASTNLAIRDLARRINTEKIDLSADNASISVGGGVGYNFGAPTYYRMPCTERGMGRRRLFHFFNSTQYDYDGVAELTVFDWNFDTDRALFKSVTGEKTEHKLLEKGKHYWGHYYNKFALKVKVPAFGYSSYTLEPLEELYKPHQIPYERREGDGSDGIVLENSKIRAVFDHGTMLLSSLTDKESGCELINKPSCAFKLITENSTKGMTSWRVGVPMNTVNINEVGDVKITEASLCGVSKNIRYEVAFATRSRLKVNVKLAENSEMLDFEITLDFHEIGSPSVGVPQVSFSVPFAYSAEKCRYDVPFGVIDREPLSFDVPANSFAVPLNDGAESSVMLISDSKYGFCFTNGNISLDLIRGSYDPDPYPEDGLHYIRVGVGAVKPDSTSYGIFRAASAFVHPVSFCAADQQVRGGSLDLDGQFIKAEGSIKISAVKIAEDDPRAIVVRFSNPSADPADYRIGLKVNTLKASVCDINENDLESISLDGGAICGTLRGYEIRTVKFSI